MYKRQIDFRAAARSVLLIGRVKREPNVRVIVHDKSSLAPEGKPVAFCLDPKTGFSWIGEYDITADELLSGAGGNNATKTEQAERLILDLLADGMSTIYRPCSPSLECIWRKDARNKNIHSVT